MVELAGAWMSLGEQLDNDEECSIAFAQGLQNTHSPPASIYIKLAGSRTAQPPLSNIQHVVRNPWNQLKNTLKQITGPNERRVDCRHGEDIVAFTKP